jgi:glycosyltransferase involved in cell wall biosynthesis
MKILHVTNAYPTAALPAYGIFVKEQIESLLERKSDDTEIFFINAREKGKLEYLRALWSLRRKLRAFDVIHCHHIFCAILVLFVRSRRNRVVVSFLSQGANELNFRTRIPFSKFVFQFVVRRSDARIFKFGVPAELKKDERTYYIPNGVNMELFKPMSKAEAKRQLGLDPGQKHMLFVSSNYLERPEKRYDKFLATLEILKSKYRLENLRPMTMANEHRERVPLHFNAADLHLLCSDVEGSPNSVKESLSCNTPVVTTDVGNVRAMIDGVPGCRISSDGSVDDLAYLCHQALSVDQQFDLRSRIVELGLDLKSVAAKVEGVYADVTADKPK